MRKAPEVVDVEDGSMHNQRSITYFNPVWTSVKVDTLVEISPIAQRNVAAEAETHTIFDSWPASCVQDQPIDQASQSDSHQGRHPAKSN